MSSSRRPSNDQCWSPLTAPRISSPSSSGPSSAVYLGPLPRRQVQQTRGNRRVVSTGSIPSSHEDPFIIKRDRVSRSASASQLPGSYPDIPTWSTAPPASDSHSLHSNVQERNAPSELRSPDSPGPRLSASVPTTPSPNPSPSSTRPSISPLSRRTRPKSASPTPSLQPGNSSEWTASRIDAEIERIVRLRLPEKERSENGVGNNYIFEAVLADTSSPPATSPIRGVSAAAATASPPRTAPRELLKIGYTQHTEHARMTQIKKTCSIDVTLRHLPYLSNQPPYSPSSSLRVSDVEEDDDRPVRLFRRVEKLVHAELAAHQHRFTCGSCGRQHREYFADLEPTLAKAVQDRWRRWVAQEPYGFDGRLLPFWEARLRQRRRNRHTATRAMSELVGTDAADEDNEMRRRSSWDEFASPFWLEKAWYDAGVVLYCVRMYRWQFSTLVMALVLAFVCFPSLLAFSCFVLAAVGVMVETQFQESLYSLSGSVMVKRWLLGRRT